MENSTIQVMGQNKYGNVEQSELQEKLDSNSKEDGKIEVIDNGKSLVVKFIESERYYEVDSNGNVSSPITIIKDEYAGDLTKGGSCDGTENNPFKISCIEDLVMFSKNVNEGNTYSGQYIELTKSLDFKSIFSYNDYQTKEYGDLNNNGVVEDIKIELTKTDDGCIGFTPIGAESKSFSGIFCGNGYQIANIYENANKNGGLFGCATNATILDVIVSGIIKSNNTAGGICGRVYTTTIKNCQNYLMIEGIYYIGGIVGYGYDDIKIINCTNFGNITNLNNGTENYSGGIIGMVRSATIINCSNEKNATISGGEKIGGIVGYLFNAAGYVKIFNSYNIGSLIGSGTSGGIIGYIYSVGFFENVYSAGNINGTNVGGIVGSALYNNTSNKFVNCYYQNSSTVTKASGKSISITATGVSKITDEVINVFNNYIDNNEEDLSEWKYWKLNDDELPMFK